MDISIVIFIIVIVIAIGFAINNGIEDVKRDKEWKRESEELRKNHIAQYDTLKEVVKDELRLLYNSEHKHYKIQAYKNGEWKNLSFNWGYMKCFTNEEEAKEIFVKNALRIQEDRTLNDESQWEDV